MINQGLFYLDWLLDHQSEFKLLVLERLGADKAGEIDWRNPRVICVASGFTRYGRACGQADEPQHRAGAVQRLQWRTHGARAGLSGQDGADDHRRLGDPGPDVKKLPAASKTVSEYLDAAPEKLRDLFVQLESYIEALGDDVTKKTPKLYFAYRRLKNFACVEVHRKPRRC